MPPLASVDNLLGGPADLHTLEGPEEDSQVLKLRMQHLAKTHKDRAHLIISRSTGQVACAVPKKGWAGPAAVQLMEGLVAQVGDGAKGGGSTQFAQGSLGEGAPSVAIAKKWFESYN